MGHAKVYLRTKFEVSRFTRSKFIKGGPKFTIFASELPTYPFWENFVICDMGDLSVYKIWCSKIYERGFKIYIFGPWTPTTPHLGEFCYSWDGTCQHLSVCTKFAVSSFARYKYTYEYSRLVYLWAWHALAMLTSRKWRHSPGLGLLPLDLTAYMYATGRKLQYWQHPVCLSVCLSVCYMSTCKARFPLPELTARVKPQFVLSWPRNCLPVGLASKPTYVIIK